MLSMPPPLAQRFDDRWRWTAIELAQARREQGEHESGKAHPDECPTPAVALRDDAAKPDPEHAAERHADGVDPDGERPAPSRSEEHTSELQSLAYLVCRLLLEKKNTAIAHMTDGVIST